MVTSMATSSGNQLQEMLSTPTNNFGLAQLLKNFVLIGEDSQVIEVSSAGSNQLSAKS